MSPNTYDHFGLLSKIIMLICFGFFIFSALAGWIFQSIWAWVAGLLYLAYDVWLIIFIVIQTVYLGRQRKRPLISPSLIEQEVGYTTQSQKYSICVIVPARNESLILPACLDALFAQQQVQIEICIVDDGSTDESASLLAQQYAIPEQQGHVQSLQYPKLSVLRLGHQGKARALNAALNYVKTDLVVTLDADTIVAPDALYAFVTAFQNNPHLVAAGGVLKPVCRPNRLTQLLNHFFQFFQQFEYIFSFLSRAAWQKSNALLLVSGAFAAYRTDILKKIGGFDPNSMVEDYELNHRIYRYAYQHNLNWTVGVVGHAYGVTDAPNGFKAFFHQRRRWFAGFLQTQFNYLDMMANRKYGVVGRLMLPMKMFDAIQPFLGLTALIILVKLIIESNPVVHSIVMLIVAKMILDFFYHSWGLYIYHRWTGVTWGWQAIPAIILATLTAPFSFQIVKMIGASLGWWIFLTKQKNWLPQREI